jgi:hypothetical protein
MSILKVNEIQDTTGKTILRNTGSVLQVVYGDMGSNTATISSQDNATIPNCSVSITPSSTSSKILLFAHVVTNIVYVNSYGFSRNGVNIGGNTNTNSSNVIAMNYQGQGAGAEGGCISISYQYLDSPATTSAITYAPTACSSWSGTLYTLRINDRNSLDMRGLTSITAMEILA